MRLEKLRQVDLNLLTIFAVIAENQSVTKASARLLLGQPAVSCALQRARSMFQDELVVRSPSGFDLTLRGRKILQELEQVLPKIEGLLVPSVFDPKKERSSCSSREEPIHSVWAIRALQRPGRYAAT
jgi:DNA-binding transcriptional LysR family regulator